jgi:hypothetical protein
MSDMSRPGPLPTAPDHQLHDPMLIAQITAGDSLDPDQQREGEWLVSSCGACAALADELRAVSGAVAWEPTPPRRRDFRLSPEQAETLQGNVLTRFVRRLALPSASALRPAAAGVMSIGLLFVVAGNVWPADTADQMSTDVVLAPAAEASAPPLPAAADGFSASEELEALDADQLGSFADIIAEQDLGSSGIAAPSRTEQQNSEIPAPDAVDASGAKKATRALEEAELADLGERVDRDLPAVASDALEPAGTPGAASITSETDAGSDDESRSDALRHQAPEPTSVAATEVDVLGGAGPAADDSLAEAVAIEGADSAISIETMLVALGLVLAAGGALLLILIWLARRTADPLLR